MTSNTMRLARTVTQLTPGQVGHRVRLRAQRAVLNKCPASRRWLLAGPPPESGDGWPAGYKPLDIRVWRGWPGRTLLRDGAVSLLGETRELAPAGEAGGQPGETGPAGRWAGADWDVPDAPVLWRVPPFY